MVKANKHRHPDFLHLGGVLHQMEGSFVAAYDWLSGPAMSEKERIDRKLAENEPVRRVGSWGF